MYDTRMFYRMPLGSPIKSQFCLHNSCSVWWRSYGPCIVQWRGCEEEGPSFVLLAQLCQPLQVKQLSDWRTPAGQEDRVEKPVLIRRCYPITLAILSTRIDLKGYCYMGRRLTNHFESRVVGRYSSKLLLP